MNLTRDGRDGRDGKRGPRGDQGPVGSPPRHEVKDGFIRFQLLKGWGEWIKIKGDDGRDGRDGIDGEDGNDGKSVTIDEVLPHIFSKIAEIPKPENGKDGKNGKDGPRGPKGPRGSDGKDGKNGDDGKSAYDLWLSDGNEGSLNVFWDWLADKVIERLKKLFPYIFNNNSGGGSGAVIRIDGGFGFTLNTRDGGEISPGHQGFITIPYNMKITEWTLLGDTNSDCVVDLWVADFNNAFPSVADSITGAVKPNLENSKKGRGSDLSGWQANLKSGQIMVVNVNSNDNARNLTIGLKGRRK